MKHSEDDSLIPENRFEDEADTTETSAYHLPEDERFDSSDEAVHMFQDREQSFSDILTERERKNRRKNILIGIAALVICAAFIVGGIFLVSNPNPQDMDARPTATNSTRPVTQEKETQSKPAVTAPTSPLTASLPRKVSVTDGQVVASGSGNQVVTSTGHRVAFIGGKVVASVNPCSVVRTIDFCYAGKVTVGGKSAYTYLLKDAAHSRFFESPQRFVSHPANGALAVASMDVAIVESSPSPVVAVVLPDGSGLMMVMPDSTDATKSTFAAAVNAF